MISLDSAQDTARQTVATVTRRAAERGYYSGARTEIINSHAELRAALDMLIKAAQQADPPAAETPALPKNDRSSPVPVSGGIDVMPCSRSRPRVPRR